MLSKNWRVAPGAKSYKGIYEDCIDDGKDIGHEPNHGFMSPKLYERIKNKFEEPERAKEFLAKFLKEHGRYPNRRDRLAMGAKDRQRRRQGTRPALRKQKREAKA